MFPYAGTRPVDPRQTLDLYAPGGGMGASGRRLDSRRRLGFGRQDRYDRTEGARLRRKGLCLCLAQLSPAVFAEGAPGIQPPRDRNPGDRGRSRESDPLGARECQNLWRGSGFHFCPGTFGRRPARRPALHRRELPRGGGVAPDLGQGLRPGRRRYLLPGPAGGPVHSRGRRRAIGANSRTRAGPAQNCRVGHARCPRQANSRRFLSCLARMSQISPRLAPACRPRFSPRACATPGSRPRPLPPPGKTHLTIDADLGQLRRAGDAEPCSRNSTSRSGGRTIPHWSQSVKVEPAGGSPAGAK